MSLIGTEPVQEPATSEFENVRRSETLPVVLTMQAEKFGRDDSDEDWQNTICSDLDSCCKIFEICTSCLNGDTEAVKEAAEDAAQDECWQSCCEDCCTRLVSDCSCVGAVDGVCCCCFCDQTPSQWRHGILDCCSEAPGGKSGWLLCCEASLCPCLLYGETANLLSSDDSDGACCAWFFLNLCGGPCGTAVIQRHTRKEIRIRHNIDGSDWQDYCCTCWCRCCTLIQERKQIQYPTAAVGIAAKPSTVNNLPRANSLGSHHHGVNPTARYYRRKVVPYLHSESEPTISRSSSAPESRTRRPQNHNNGEPIGPGASKSGRLGGSEGQSHRNGDPRRTRSGEIRTYRGCAESESESESEATQASPASACHGRGGVPAWARDRRSDGGP